MTDDGEEEGPDPHDEDLVGIAVEEGEELIPDDLQVLTSVGNIQGALLHIA